MTTYQAHAPHNDNGVLGCIVDGQPWPCEAVAPSPALVVTSEADDTFDPTGRDDGAGETSTEPEVDLS